MPKKAFLEGKPDWSEYLGSLSDRYAKFYLAAQREAQKIDPQATLMAFAYANYSKPPMETKLNDRIIMFIVPEVMYPWTPAKREAAKVQWDGWSKTGVKMVLRPNYGLDGHNMPIFVARKFGEDFTYAYRHGMIGTDISALTGQYGVQGPGAYLQARIHENPEWPVDQILEEYYGGFGPAREQVRAYFKHWEAVDAGVTDDFYTREIVSKTPEGGTWARFYRAAGKVFTPAVMAKGFALLDEAKRAASGDAAAERRVKFLEEGLRNTQLTLDTQIAYVQYKKTGNLQVYRDALEKLDAFRAAVEGDYISNMELSGRIRSQYLGPRPSGDVKDPRHLAGHGLEIHVGSAKKRVNPIDGSPRISIPQNGWRSKSGLLMKTSRSGNSGKKNTARITSARYGIAFP